ncbi:hypothetical protein SDC9_182824 [bioreactor metagenome]|uniref:Uncharacterized protein n=1 Tax=bioreactor metagenome TaxID=1076179 RepID=A0A645H8G1_9ZZZZ
MFKHIQHIGSLDAAGSANHNRYIVVAVGQGNGQRAFNRRAGILGLGLDLNAVGVLVRNQIIGKAVHRKGRGQGIAVYAERIQ